MAFARDVYTAAGGQTDFTISFPYQEQEDVRVYQNGSLVDTADYTFPNATTVRLDTGATASDTIVLQRYTSQDTRDVDFTAGPLTESDLDNSAIQLFYMAQEAIDISNSGINLGTGTDWDADGNRIINLGTGTAGTDAVNLDQVTALIVDGGNVPGVVDPTDNNKVLTANDGTFSWQLPTGDNFSNINVDTFVDGVDYTSGTTGGLTLSGFPGDENNTQIFFDGVYQQKTTYTLASGAVTFDAVIPLGVSQVEVVYGQLADYLAATGTSYSNTTSGLAATDVQEAIDEIVDEFVPNTNATSYGFYTTVNAVDSTNDIDISAGQCWDTTRASFMAGSAMTKRGDAAWSVGNNGGFIDTGAMSSDEGYHIYVMLNDQDGSVDYIMSLSGTWAGVTKPTNYTKGQIVGYAYRDTAWVEILWSGNSGYYEEARQAFYDSTITDENFETYEFKGIPRNSVGIFSVSVTNSTSGSTFPIYARHTNASALGFNGETLVAYAANSSSPTGLGAAFPFLSDSSRSIQLATYEKSGVAVMAGYFLGFELPDRLEATS